MRGALGALRALNARADRAAAGLVGAFVAAMFLVVVAQVFFRYVLNASLVWAEEAARYLLVLTTFLGASVAMRRGGHIAVRLFVDWMPAPARRAVELFAHAVSCLVYAVLIWHGGALARENFTQASPAIGLPLGGLYLMIPLAGALLALEALERIGGLLLGGRGAAPARRG